MFANLINSKVTPMISPNFTPAPPLKRALRNGLIIALVIIGVTFFQGETWAVAMLNGGFSWVVITPALYLSYRLTQKIARPAASKTQKSGDGTP